MFRHALRSVAATVSRSAIQPIAGLAVPSVVAHSSLPTLAVPCVPAFSFASKSKRGPPLKKRKIKVRQQVNMHKLRLEHAKRFIDDDEEYVEPRPDALGDALINACTVLERMPIVISKIPDWELRWLMREDSLAFMRSVELPMPLRRDLYGKNSLVDRLPEDLDVLPTGTVDDENKNRKSIYRRIDRPLYLLVKVKQTFDPSLPSEIWQFPTGEWRKGETLRSAAERGLFFSMGDIASYYLGNAPICALEREATAEHKKEFPQVTKVKSFFHHSIFLGGKIDLDPESGFMDYAWVTKEEFPEYFTTPVTAPLIELAESVLYYNIDSDPEDYPRPPMYEKVEPLGETDWEDVRMQEEDILKVRRGY